MTAISLKFIGLLRPFALLAGVVSLSMLLMHGAAWLSLKAEGVVAEPGRADRHLVAGAGALAPMRWPGSGWRSASTASPSWARW
jgi:cytochrome d ubiquinol oxidase subunit II